MAAVQAAAPIPCVRAPRWLSWTCRVIELSIFAWKNMTEDRVIAVVLAQ